MLEKHQLARSFACGKMCPGRAKVGHEVATQGPSPETRKARLLTHVLKQRGRMGKLSVTPIHAIEL